MQEDIGHTGVAGPPSKSQQSASQNKPASSKRARRTGEQGDDNSADAVDVEASQTLPSRRYTTRSGNQDRHPGRDVGLNWHAEKEEREAAAATRAEKKGQQERKQEEKRRKAQAQAKGVRRIAELENEWEEEEREEEVYLASNAARGYREASLEGGFLDHDDDGIVGSQKTLLSSPSPGPRQTLSDGDSSSSQEDDEEPVTRSKVR